jgi:hydroxymethylpyrimidine/phosphomethylpyrimidine kinase
LVVVVNFGCFLTKVIPAAGKTPSAEHTLAQRVLPGERAQILRQIADFPEMCTKPVALTIAGFDPGSGAGMTADLKTFAAHGVYGVACISALTVQSTLGVRAVEPLSPSLVRQTLECLAEDVSFAGIKIGMLGSSAVAEEVVSFLAVQSAKVGRQRIVLDPLVRSTSGSALIDANGISVLRDQLLHWVGWITPNIEELAILIGEASSRLEAAQVPAAAARLKELALRQGNGELNVVVTGGDLDRPDDFLLAAGGESTWLPGEKVATNSTHGTGCAFSSALLCAQISGLGRRESALAAKAYVTEALRSAYPVGKGKGPMNHLYRCDPC